MVENKIFIEPQGGIFASFKWDATQGFGESPMGVLFSSKPRLKVGFLLASSGEQRVAFGCVPGCATGGLW